jgi:hypothetical protein
MIISELREWLLRNGKEDEWWLDVDGVTEELPASLSTVEEFLSGEYNQVKIIHSSSSNVEGASWITVQKAAPVVKPASIPQGAIQPSQVVEISTTPVSGNNEINGASNLNAFALIAAWIPLAAAFFLFAKIPNMPLRQGPLSAMITINYATFLIIAVLVGIDAAKLRMGVDKSKGNFEPATWGVLVFFFSVISLPWYLYHRKKFGGKSYFLLGFLNCILWLATGKILSLNL